MSQCTCRRSEATDSWFCPIHGEMRRTTQIAALAGKMFPIQRERGALAHPLLIPWSLAELAYSVYSGRYGTSQTLKRLAERGGFGPSEMDAFVPDWRVRCDAITTLTADLAAARQQLADEREIRLRNEAVIHDRGDEAQADLAAARKLIAEAVEQMQQSRPIAILGLYATSFIGVLLAHDDSGKALLAYAAQHAPTKGADNGK